MKKVLIVGGSGFIALNLIEKFLSESYRVFVYGLTKPKIESENLSFLQGNLDEIDSYSAELNKLNIYNAIYLVNTISVNAVVNDYEESLKKNKKALYSLSKIVKRVVFFSSGGRVYPSCDDAHDEVETLEPLCMYGKSKAALEAYLESISKINNKQYLIVRPSNPYGKYQNINGKQGLIAVLIGKILAGQPISIWGTGTEVRDYIYIDDFIYIFFKLFEKSNLSHCVYNIGSGSGTSSLDILDAIYRVFGEKVERNYTITPTNQPLISKNILSNKRIFKEVGDINFTSIEKGITLFLKELE